jgi:hypothetical protein
MIPPPPQRHPTILGYHHHHRSRSDSSVLTGPQDIICPPLWALLCGARARVMRGQPASAFPLPLPLIQCPSQPFSRGFPAWKLMIETILLFISGIPPLRHDMISVTAPLTTLDHTLSIEYQAYTHQIIILKFRFFNFHCPGPTSLKPC